jgi:hypothetical protein
MSSPECRFYYQVAIEGICTGFPYAQLLSVVPPR